MQWQNTAPSQFAMYRGKHPDGTHRYSFALSPWVPDVPQKLNGSPVSNSADKPTREVNGMSGSASNHANEKDFIRRFFDLGFGEQRKILDEFGLMDKKESALPQFMQIKNALKRAREKGLMDEILKKINNGG
jgi:hypothetical protein